MGNGPEDDCDHNDSGERESESQSAQTGNRCLMGLMKVPAARIGTAQVTPYERNDRRGNGETEYKTNYDRKKGQNFSKTIGGKPQYCSDTDLPELFTLNTISYLNL